ncbi:MAG: DUF4062 domain-containing protein [Armatimonadota bacterium]
MSSPRVFISSTIHDFSDLRSAIRYYLDSLGLDVVMSEYNDFSGSVSANSYDACLSAIESCDYFILLIGSRIGGWYNEEEGLTITWMEYRAAYEQLMRGRLKILTFVRKSLWNLKQDRKALADFLLKDYKCSKELSEGDIDAISHHRSSFANDAKTLFKFIDEVGRIEDMRKAKSSEDPFPLGNWIYTFDGFEDIVSAIQVQLGFVQPITELAMLSNLRDEIIANLTRLLIATESGISRGYGGLARLDINELDSNNLAASFISIPTDCVRLMGWYALFEAPKAELLSTRYAHKALESGILHTIDLNTRQIHLTRLGVRVMELVEQIRKFKGICDCFKIRREAFTEYTRKTSGVNINISVLDVFTLLSARHRHEDIIALSQAIISAIDGNLDTLDAVVLNPLSPSTKTSEELETETPSYDAIENWIKEVNSH